MASMPSSVSAAEARSPPEANSCQYSGGVIVFRHTRSSVLKIGEQPPSHRTYFTAKRAAPIKGNSAIQSAAHSPRATNPVNSTSHSKSE